MNNQLNNLQTNKKYDLEERTAKFAENVIDLMKRMPFNPIIASPEVRLKLHTLNLSKEKLRVNLRKPQTLSLWKFINVRMIEQLVACSGSIGANYCEANEAESRKDFIHKVGITKKETKESKHWIRLLARANPNFSDEFRILWEEAQELLLIFSAIVRSSRLKV